MPTFTLLSGHLSKTILSANSLRSLLDRILWPYFAYNLLRWLWQAALAPSTASTVLLSPNQTNLQIPLFDVLTSWYLLCLFKWRIAFPLFSQIRRSLWLPIVLIFALVAGYSPDAGILGGNHNYRGIQMFPFFILGALLPRDFLTEKLRSRWISVALLFPFGGFLIWLCWYGTGPTNAVFLDQDKYSNDPYGILWHVFYFVIATFNIFTVFAWIPKARIPYITDLGQHTMYPYLLQRFFWMACDAAGWFTAPSLGLACFYVFILPFILICVLSSKPIRWLFWPMIEPNLSRFYVGENIEKVVENGNHYQSLENGEKKKQEIPLLSSERV